ncbi:phage tail protein [Brachybacterium sp. J144]|uniref:phage tail protein n=1 Tax=Brachybacterium sp. J144 TaxID=3116487 RepID=UPI002E79CD4A|nr:phage tail protein [Brachybacterium sp. J144]MEE1652021.1 phage tail protein [Brachybacterium sp. J144]
MPAQPISFTEVSTAGLESSPVADTLAGLRANEARYFSTKYSHTFTTTPAAEAPETLVWVEEILRSEREIQPSSPALEVSITEVDGIFWVHVFYESGLALNVLWTRDDGGKRAVGFKLSEGMDVPPELATFKFARQKSKLAGEIRGSYFVIKAEHPLPSGL